MTNREIAETIAAQTNEEYSYERYGDSMWTANIECLLEAGYSSVEAEKIMESKIARWAADVNDDLIGSRIILDYCQKFPKIVAVVIA